MAASGIRSLTEALRSLSVSSAAPIRSGTSVIANNARVVGMNRSITTTTTAVPQNFTTDVPVTIHSFPALEPVSLEQWSSRHLYVPLRRDILHRAVIFEGDSTRQGTASTKTRWDVHGSKRKVRPQKGSGRARAGSRQSPIFRGGGVVFGPHPRDFSTDLPRKMYDKAWRMALSYRYRRGELVVCEDGMELPLISDFTSLRDANFLEPQLAAGYLRKQAVQMLEAHQWDRSHGRTLFITNDVRDNLFDSLDEAGDHGRVLVPDEVDVKDLLEEGRLVIERSALQRLISEHQSDLISKIVIDGVLPKGPELGKTIVA
ncbi:54S ribosomal protein yml6, mitochondrial [Ceratocystis pirilliformis]|uniref:Large ribosomal subunit protein uL4m n=1 Tax=Ceratocystis pirilliformis TaxID=259994 RepID=A0ABR3YXA0_9PEZI